jgi:hypothetical protein
VAIQQHLESGSPLESLCSFWHGTQTYAKCPDLCLGSAGLVLLRIDMACGRQVVGGLSQLPLGPAPSRIHLTENHEGYTISNFVSLGWRGSLESGGLPSHNAAASILIRELQLDHLATPRGCTPPG